MSDQDTTDDNAGGPVKRTLSLKPSSGTVRQSFSHGRSNSVVVEKRKRRIVLPGQEGSAAAGSPEPASAVPQQSAKAATPSSPSAPKVVTQVKRRIIQPGQGTISASSAPSANRSATNAEQEARLNALKEAQHREVEENRRAQEAAHLRAIEEARLKKEAEAQARLLAEEAARVADEDVRRPQGEGKGKADHRG